MKNESKGIFQVSLEGDIYAGPQSIGTKSPEREKGKGTAGSWKTEMAQCVSKEQGVQY